MTETVLWASYANVWAHCGASVNMKRHRMSTDRQIEGLLLHKLTRLISHGEFGVEPTLDAIVNSGKFTPDDSAALTAEHLDMALRVSAYTAGLGDTRPMREYGVDYEISTNVRISGVLDYACYDRLHGALHLAEYKFGYTPVHPGYNWPLICYAAGLAQAGVPEFPYKLEKLVFHICQPRDYANGPFKIWTVPVKNWSAIFDEFRIRARNAGGVPSNSAPAETGAHCRYCESRVYCPTFQSAMLSVTDLVSHNTDALPPDAISREYEYLLKTKKLVNSALAAAESRIKHEIETGNPVPGWTLLRKSGRRRLTNDIKRLRFMSKMLNGVALTEERPVALSKLPQSIMDKLGNLIETAPGAEYLAPFDETSVKQVFNNDE